MGAIHELQGSSSAESSSAPLHWGKLNEFQKTLLQWAGLHPYNAVHIIEIGRTLTPESVKENITRVLDICHLGQVQIDEQRGTYTFRTGVPHVPLRVLEVSSEDMLDAEITRQLNEPFPTDSSFTPFRFFLCHGPTSSRLGVAYFHVVADAESVTRLLLEITRQVLADQPTTVCTDGLLPLHSSRVSSGSLFSTPWKMFRAVKKIRALRQSYRPPLCKTNDFRNEYFRFELEREDTARVLSKARSWGVTVNDLCLAATLLADAAITQNRFQGSRPQLSVGCIVNLRRDVKEARRRDFGLFLGFFTVTHLVPPDITFQQLARDIHAQTQTAKERKLYLAAPFELRTSRFIFGRMPVEKKRNFYRKSYPVWGGITNMRVDELCRASGIEGILGYHRGVSTGPALPYAVGITGACGQLNFGVSFRPIMISRAQIEDIMDQFSKLLTEPDIPA